jgi:VWFA-related protein
MKIQCMILVLAAPLLAQSQATFSVDVNLVRVPCIVTRANGTPVQNLRKEDFIVLEDGKPQPVKYLWQETDLPLTIVVVVDISFPHIKMSGLAPHPNQYTEDILQVLQRLASPDRRLAIVAVTNQAKLVTDLTGSLETLRAGAAQIRDAGGPILGDPCTGKRPGPWRGLGDPCGFSVLWDAVFFSAEMKLLPQTGRKALLLLTGGLDTGSDHTLSDAIAACQRAGTMVYSVRDPEQYQARAESWQALTGRSVEHNYLSEKPDLERISRETGGLAFDRATAELPVVLDRIEADLGSQYVLGFVPSAAHGTRNLHKLQVKVALPDLKVRAQDRYYAQ